MRKTQPDLAAALDVAGAEMPAAIVDAQARRDYLQADRFRPSLGHPVKYADLMERLATAPPGDLDAVLDDVAVEYNRRAAVAEMRTGLDHRFNRMGAEARAEVADEVHERLATAFDQRARELGKVAGRLPDGPAALDPTAVLAADARRAYLTACDVLDDLVVLARGITVPDIRIGSQPVRGADVALVAEVPATTRTRLAGLTRARLNDDTETATNDIVRRLAEAFAADPRLTMVDIARGTFAGVTLAYAATPAALTERLDRIREGHTTVVQREAVA